MRFNTLRRFHSWQKSGLTYHLDPIANPAESAIVPEEPVDQRASSSPSKWSLTFFFPFFTILFATLHGNVFLPFTVGVPLSWASLSTTPALLYRQMYLPVMWPQTDMAVSIAVLGALAIYASFRRHPWTLPRYVLVWGTEERPCPLLRIGRTILSPDSSLKILKAHRRIRKTSFVGFVVCSVFICLFLFANTFLNGFYSFTNGHFLFSLFLIIPFFNALLYAFVGIPTFLILASVCIQMRQKDVISQMSALNEKVCRLKKDKPERIQKALVIFRQQNLNRSVLSIVSQLEAYATYWTPSLSLYLLSLTTTQTYLAYPVCIDGLPFIQKCYFLYIVLEIDAALFYLIDVCARVVKLNRRIEGENRNFYLLLAKKGAFKGKNICRQLKCEALSLSYRLRPYAFHLFDNYRITSRTFYMVFSNIALFFLLVFKQAM